MALELTAEDIRVLHFFLHPENCENISKEGKLPINVVKDIVYNLFHYRFIKNAKGGMLFPKDKLKTALFIATAKGIEALQTQ